MKQQLLLAAACSAVICSCAKVEVRALDPTTGMVKKNSAPGLRYYLPKPYLLVMRLPESSEVVSPAIQTIPRAGGRAHPDGTIGPGTAITPSAGVAGGGAAASDDKSSGDTKAGAAGSATTNTGFQISNDSYTAKLIYLPDLSQPMAITATGGLFGATTMGAVLQDGWMLTSLQGSADSKVAETLASVGGLLKGGGGASNKAGGGPKDFDDKSGQVLPPGLYGFEKSGPGLKLCTATLFEHVSPSIPVCTDKPTE